MKFCHDCSIEKPLTEFYRRRDGRVNTTRCAECDKKRSKEYRQKHKVEIQNRRKLTRTTQQNRKLNLRSKYGIEIAEWEKLFNLQNRKCAICLTGEPKGRGWQTDHDHKTSQIRGILCHSCNSLLGHSKDKMDILQMAISYLKMHGGKKF